MLRAWAFPLFPASFTHADLTLILAPRHCCLLIEIRELGWPSVMDMRVTLVRGSPKKTPGRTLNEWSAGAFSA